MLKRKESDFKQTRDIFKLLAKVKKPEIEIKCETYDRMHKLRNRINHYIKVHLIPFKLISRSDTSENYFRVFINLHDNGDSAEWSSNDR